MNDAMVLIFKLASIILIAIIGYLVAAKKVLGNNAKDVISLLLNRVALPIMIFAAYSRIKLSQETLINSAYVIIAALVVYLLNYVYAKLLVKRYKLSNKQRSVFINGGVHANTAFLAFPLLYAVYRDDGLFYATMFYMVDNILLFTLGLKRFMQDHEGPRKLAPVTKALMISLPMMVIANLLKVDLTGNFVYQTANDLGALTTPLAFLFIGMIVYESDVKELLINRPVINLIFVKMTIIPLIMVLSFKLLNLNLESLVIVCVMVQALMPPFSSLLSMAYEYEQDVPLATSLVVLGHIYSIVSIPLIFVLVTYLFR